MPRCLGVKHRALRVPAPPRPRSEVRARMNRPALLEALADRIAAVVRPHPLRVAIDGVDGVGKTTLANELVDPLRRRGRPVIRASIDGFHNPRSVRYRLGRSSPEGYYKDSF